MFSSGVRSSWVKDRKERELKAGEFHPTEAPTPGDC